MAFTFSTFREPDGKESPFIAFPLADGQQIKRGDYVCVHRGVAYAVVSLAETREGFLGVCYGVAVKGTNLIWVQTPSSDAKTMLKWTD